MSSRLSHLVASPSRLAPVLFVILWSTGFIGAKLGLPYAPPLTFLAWRFGLVVLLLMPLTLYAGTDWPRRPRLIAHLALVGVLVHGFYLGGVFVAIAHGLAAGTAALIVSLQPLLVGALAGPLLGERVGARQWLGLGLGLAGCALVVAPKLVPGSAGTIALCICSLMAITIGTLYQKRYGTGVDVQAANLIQFSAAFLVTAPLAVWVESGDISWTPSFVLALFWLVVLSLGAVSLLLLLIRRGAASRVSNLFFLVPPTTAIIAFLVFDETMTAYQMIGMVVAALGVALVNLRAT